MDNSDAKNDLLIKINEINGKITAIENAYTDIFSQTAETKAQNKTMDWWVLNLSYIDEDGAGYKPIFGEGDDEAKLTKYDEIYEKEDVFTNECIKKLSYLISFWLASRNSTEKINFVEMDKLYNEKLTDYKIVDDVAIKVEDKSESPKIVVDTAEALKST